MSESTEVINLLAPYVSPQNLFYVALVGIPLLLLMKWGLTPRNFIEFLDFVYERKLKKIDHDIAYFSDTDVQKQVLERERVFLINAHHTGIKKVEFQEVILKTIASSNGKLPLNAYKHAADHLRKKDNGLIYIKLSYGFWLNWAFTFSYSLLVGFLCNPCFASGHCRRSEPSLWSSFSLFFIAVIYPNIHHDIDSHSLKIQKIEPIKCTT